MGLKTLIDWANENKDREKLKKIVRKDIKGAPLENDIVVCTKLLEEVVNRAKLSEEFMKKALKFEKDIAEYLEELDKRGVKYGPAPAEDPVRNDNTTPSTELQQESGGQKAT